MMRCMLVARECSALLSRASVNDDERTNERMTVCVRLLNSLQSFDSYRSADEPFRHARLPEHVKSTVHKDV